MPTFAGMAVKAEQNQVVSKCFPQLIHRLTRLKYNRRMGLEHWDSARKKYVLYRTMDEHGEDCARFPFASIPQRVFLDTNVINVLVKQSAEIFEHEPISADINRTLAIDIEALRHVFYVGSRANWDLVTSSKAIEELSRTRNQELRDELVEYGVGFMDLESEAGRFALDFGRRMIEAPFVAALPDVADRELVGHALGLRCDAFCTCDRATILSKRHRLRQIPLRIITPAEWWAHVKPWAGLWW